MIIYILPDYNKFTIDIADTKIKQEKLATEDDIADFVKEADFGNKIKNKITSNKIKLQTYNSGLFIGENYFGNDGSQNYLICQWIYKTLCQFVSIPGTVAEWESERFLNEKITPLLTAIIKMHSQVWEKMKRWKMKNKKMTRWKILFISPQKLFSLSRCLSFCLDFLVI